MKPFISAIVPVYNNESMIVDCIKSLSNQNYPKSLYEIIVVDNNSSDNTVNFTIRLKIRNLRIYCEKKQSSYAARNKGARKSKGKILLFTDSDCIVEKNSLRRISKAFKKENIDIIKGNLRVYNCKGPLLSYQQNYYDNKINSQKSFYFETNSMAVRKKSFFSVGMFDEKFISGGDNDLSIRAKNRGLKIKYDKDVIIYHKCRENIVSYFEMTLFNGKGKITLLRKHNGKLIIPELISLKNYFSSFFYFFLFVINGITSLIMNGSMKEKDYWLLYKSVENAGFRLGMILGFIRSN